MSTGRIGRLWDDAAPRMRSLCRCGLPRDAQLPEVWTRRPVVAVAGDRTLSGTVVVVPCSSQDQDGNPFAVPLAERIDGVGPSWAVCDTPTTVAVSRLSLDRYGRRRLTPEEFTAVLALVLRRFPALAPPAA